MISAENGDGINDLKEFMAARMPTGPWLYPEDEATDMPARLLAADGIVVAEHFHKHVLPETIGRLVNTRSVRIGDHRLTFYARHAGGEGPPEGPAPDGRGGAA